MAIYAFKPAFRRALAPIGRLLVRTGISADAITIAGLIFAALGGLGVWVGRHGGPGLLLVPAGALLRTAANALDGWIAQETKSSRPLGEVLNETADRVADVAMFLPIALVPGVPDLLVAGAVAAMLVVSFLGVVIKAAGGPRVYAGVMGKPDRMLVLGIAAIAGLVTEPRVAFTVALWVVFFGAALTLVQRAVIARRALGRVT
jgi:CDP-diacylglycerol--glycerol-3-phosphate 3-phosphatidyltransferase